MSYRARFKPEVYLKFLNANHIFELTIIDDAELSLYATGCKSIDGCCAEECLDKAILESGFDKTL